MRPGNRLARDRSLRFSDLAVALFLLVVGCVRVPEPVVREEVHRVEVWVDAFSPAGGDGTPARPLKTVPEPVPMGAVVHLRSGLYAGPFVLGDGARLEGLGEVVLTGEAGQTVVTAANATLDGLSVQGGAIGLEAGPGVVVTRAHFSGQRQRAVVVHGSLTMSEARLEASVEGIDGVSVDRGASLELTSTKFTGGFRRAVLSEGGTLTLRSVSGEGPKTLVHALDATSRLENLRSVLGSGPALFFAGGRLHLVGAELIGHEYSVQLSRGVDATLSNLQARDALEGCLSAIASKLSLSASSFTGCGPLGALTLQDSRVQVKDVEITSSRELGIFAKRGTLGLLDVRISKISADREGWLGDALHVRDGVVVTSLGSLTLSDLGGSGLFASAFAEVHLGAVSVERARASALFVERGATVSIRALLVRGGGGPAVVVPDRASVELESLSVSGGNEMPVYAECQAGAQVVLGRLESTVQQLPSLCVLNPAGARIRP
ncbi:MAG: hypothetical protein Q8L48_23790 [Archangium sp.]|nr:hypothetical protein [Archangium sp.]